MNQEEKVTKNRLQLFQELFDCSSKVFIIKVKQS